MVAKKVQAVKIIIKTLVTIDTMMKDLSNTIVNTIKTIIDDFTKMTVESIMDKIITVVEAMIATINTMITIAAVEVVMIVNFEEVKIIITHLGITINMMTILHSLCDRHQKHLPNPRLLKNLKKLRKVTSCKLTT